VLKAVNASGTPLLRFRYGLGVPGTYVWSAWQSHLILSHEALPEGTGPSAGHTVKLYTGDLLRVLSRVVKIKAYRGTISKIVGEIATANGLTDTVIEPTVGDGLWVQTTNDADFIRDRLVCRAKSARGRGNYVFFVRDNVLHFHTFDYQTQIKELNYYAASHANLTLSDLSQSKLNAGASGVLLIVHDPYTGQSEEIKTDRNVALRLANSIHRLDKVVGAERTVGLHMSTDRLKEGAHIAQNAYESARSECFQLKFMVERTAPLRAGDLLRINVDPSAENASTWSGLYATVSANHQISKGAIQSVYILQRGEQLAAKGSTNSIRTLGVESLQDEQNAPGVEINVPEAQSSSLTRGAGKAVSSGVFLTVQDKNDALS
jgi:hypothetical protein